MSFHVMRHLSLWFVIYTVSQKNCATFIFTVTLANVGRFLADSTYGRAIGTVLRPSSSSSVTLCIVAKRCVVEQKLQLRAYRKSYIRNRLVPK